MKARRLIAVAAVTLGLSGAAVAAAYAATVTLSGSTSIQPLAEQLAGAYVKENKGAKFVVLAGSSDIGINDVARGRVSIGMSSRDPKSADPGGIVFNKFARDSICIVTSPSNPLPSLSQETVQNIFSGRIRSWSQVEGSNKDGSINLVTRSASSGTADAFQNIIMGEDLRVSGTADEQPSNGLQANAIKSDQDGLAIGYASFSFVKGLSSVPYEGVPCTLRNAKSGQYGAIRNFYFVTRGKAKGETKKFIDFARKSSKAQKIIGTEWVPLK